MIKLADIACSLLANIIVIATVPFSKVYKWCVRRVRERGKKNILVYSCDLLGDNIIRMPFFLALRNRFPKEQYHISAVLTRSMGNFLSKLDIFDEIIEDGILNDRHPIFWLFERKRFVCGAIRWAFRNDVDILIWTLRMRCRKLAWIGAT